MTNLDHLRFAPDGNRYFSNGMHKPRKTMSGIESSSFYGESRSRMMVEQSRMQFNPCGGKNFLQFANNKRGRSNYNSSNRSYNGEDFNRCVKSSPSKNNGESPYLWNSGRKKGPRSYQSKTENHKTRPAWKPQYEYGLKLNPAFDVLVTDEENAKFDLLLKDSPNGRQSNVQKEPVHTVARTSSSPTKRHKAYTDPMGGRSTTFVSNTSPRKSKRDFRFRVRTGRITPQKVKRMLRYDPKKVAETAIESNQEADKENVVCNNCSTSAPNEEMQDLLTSLKKTPNIPFDDDPFEDTFLSQNTVDQVEEKIIGPIPLPCNEKTIDDSVCLPYEIGFPNPAGTNKCWMNAALQVILGMGTFIDDVVTCFKTFNGMQARNSHLVLRTFIDVVKKRKKGLRSNVDKAVSNFSKALGTLDSSFTSDTQQDAPEFLVRILDYFREECRQLITSEKVKAAECVTLRELQLENNNKVCTNSVNDKEEISDPVMNNVEFRMKEDYNCKRCSENTSKVQDHLLLFLDIPRISDGHSPSLQLALNQYMKPDVRELNCSKCGCSQSNVETSFKKIPRYLIIQLKRYKYEGRSPEKLTDSIRITQNLSVKHFMDSDVIFPKDLEKIEEISYAEEDPLMLVVPVEEQENMVIDEDKDLQEALRQSLNENEKEMEREEKELQEAISQSLMDHKKLCYSQESPIKDQIDGEEVTQEEEDVSEYSYRLTGIMSHHGTTPNSGHYVADVYNFKERDWYHYDDDNVAKVTEDEVNQSCRRNGYVFIYTHQNIFKQLIEENV